MNGIIQNFQEIFVRNHMMYDPQTKMWKAVIQDYYFYDPDYRRVFERALEWCNDEKDLLNTSPLKIVVNPLFKTLIHV